MDDAIERLMVAEERWREVAGSWCDRMGRVRHDREIERARWVQLGIRKTLARLLDRYRVERELRANAVRLAMWRGWARALLPGDAANTYLHPGVPTERYSDHELRAGVEEHLATRGAPAGARHDPQLTYGVDHVEADHGRLEWWDWWVTRQTSEGEEPLAQGVSWTSEEEARACLRAVLLALGTEERCLKV